ncbi:MAG: histidine triad nucleotide-binding protein [Blastocatellia bacterium]|nr:histidine triad nucleotide-binding protein [Blastocatellia bacterium]
MNCIFCSIVEGKIPAKIVYQDTEVIAFHDVSPKAPTHLLVIPREHIDSLNGAKAENETLLGHILHVCSQVAKNLGLAESGYRVVTNTGAGAGQSVFHIHFHLLGGRTLGWPPG